MTLECYFQYARYRVIPACVYLRLGMQKRKAKMLHLELILLASALYQFEIAISGIIEEDT